MDPDLYEDTVPAMKQGLSLPPVTILDTRFQVTGEPM